MNVHIYVATGTHYRIRTHIIGYRKWYPEKGKFKTLKGAAKKLAEIMTEQSGLNRGEVLLCADYYDPTPILTMVRP